MLGNTLVFGPAAIYLIAALGIGLFISTPVETLVIRKYGRRIG